jgi:hypothetical protein
LARPGGEVGVDENVACPAAEVAAGDVMLERSRRDARQRLIELLDGAHGHDGSVIGKAEEESLLGRQVVILSLT